MCSLVKVLWRYVIDFLFIVYLCSYLLICCFVSTQEYFAHMETFIGTNLALEQGGIFFIPHLVWHAGPQGFLLVFFFVPFKGQLPKLSCKRHWGSVLSLGLIERHSLRSTLLQNVMLRKKAPYNVYQCISVFNKWHFESIGSFSLVWNSHWNPCYT